MKLAADGDTVPGDDVDAVPGPGEAGLQRRRHREVAAHDPDLGLHAERRGLQPIRGDEVQRAADQSQLTLVMMWPTRKSARSMSTIFMSRTIICRAVLAAN